MTRQCCDCDREGIVGLQGAWLCQAHFFARWNELREAMRHLADAFVRAAEGECNGAPVSDLREGDATDHRDPARIYRTLLGLQEPRVPLQPNKE